MARPIIVLVLAASFREKFAKRNAPPGFHSRSAPRTLNMPPLRPPFRAEHIGSLLRPPELLRARHEHSTGKLGNDGLEAIENEAIRRAVELQESTGIEVITDGEFRRGTYSDSFTSTGISGVEVELTEEGGFKQSETHGHRMARRIPRVVGRIEWKGPQGARDFRYLKSLTRFTPKVTIPGPCYIHYRAGRGNISQDVYPDLDHFWSDLVSAYHREMRSLAGAGCTYLQIDETSLVKLGDPRVRDLLAERGDDWRDLLRIYIGVINAVVAGAPKGLTVGIHICRSQDPSWQADVGYDAIAKQLFNDMNVSIYFLEYDNARAGSLLPLRAVPPDKFVVLGIVSSKIAQLETADYLKRRIEEASRYIRLEQLGLSPQCGFATSAEDKGSMTEELECKKLARIVEVARQVWGD
jgi:5-methyltetrahydropteroyltriglutamate--homocysteine methyltransferase